MPSKFHRALTSNPCTCCRCCPIAKIFCCDWECCEINRRGSPDCEYEKIQNKLIEVKDWWFLLKKWYDVIRFLVYGSAIAITSIGFCVYLIYRESIESFQKANCWANPLFLPLAPKFDAYIFLRDFFIRFKEIILQMGFFMISNHIAEQAVHYFLKSKPKAPGCFTCRCACECMFRCFCCPCRKICSRGNRIEGGEHAESKSDGGEDTEHESEWTCRCYFEHPEPVSCTGKSWCEYFRDVFEYTMYGCGIFEYWSCFQNQEDLLEKGLKRVKCLVGGEAGNAGARFELGCLYQASAHATDDKQKAIEFENKAYREFQSCFEHDPLHQKNIVQLAIYHEKFQKEEEAQNLYEYSLVKFPDSWEIINNYAVFVWRRSRRKGKFPSLKDVELVLEKFGEYGDSTEGSLCCCGFGRSELKNEKALFYWNYSQYFLMHGRREIPIDDSDEMGWLTVIRCKGSRLEENADDIEKAKEKLQRAIELDPKFTDCYIYLGILFRNNDHQEEAMANFNKALSIEPKHSEALYYKALDIYKGEGRKRDAVKHLDDAIAASASYPRFDTSQALELWLDICIDDHVKAEPERFVNRLLNIETSMKVEIEENEQFQNKLKQLYSSHPHLKNFEHSVLVQYFYCGFEKCFLCCFGCVDWNLTTSPFLIDERDNNFFDCLKESVQTQVDFDDADDMSFISTSSNKDLSNQAIEITTYAEDSTELVKTAPNAKDEEI